VLSERLDTPAPPLPDESFSERVLSPRDYLLSSDLQGRLFSLVKNIVRNVSVTLHSLTPFSREAVHSSPSLLFINILCQLYSLDHSLEQEVRLLKRNLLQLIDVKEFSAEAKFVYPTPTFVLSDVSCTFCNLTRDLDLCRDPDIVSRNWCCSQCHNLYDVEMIENQLVERANQLAIAYELQDLQCLKCSQIKNTYLHSVCQCSGGFTTRMPSTEATIDVLGQIAQFYNMQYLSHAVKWMRK